MMDHAFNSSDHNISPLTTTGSVCCHHLGYSGAKSVCERRFGRTYHLHLQGKKSAEQETMVQQVARQNKQNNFHMRTAWHHIPEEDNVYNYAMGTSDHTNGSVAHHLQKLGAICLRYTQYAGGREVADAPRRYTNNGILRTVQTGH
jgi:hypothetical protein